MNPLARFPRRRSTAASSPSPLRAAARATIECLELRRFLSVTPIEAERTIIDDVAASDEKFASSIATNGSLALIATPQHSSDTSTLNGKVTLVDTSDGDILHTFEGPADFGFFGGDVAWVDGKIVIGAEGLDTIFVFDATSYSALDPIENPNPGNSSGFGSSLAAIGDDLLVGNNFGGLGEVLRFDLDLADDGNTAEDERLTGEFRSTDTNLTQLGTAIAASNGEIFAAAKNGSSGVVVKFNAGTGADDVIASYPSPVSALAVTGSNLLVGVGGANAVYQLDLADNNSLVTTYSDAAGLGDSIAVNGGQVALGGLNANGGAVYVYNLGNNTPIASLVNPAEASNDGDFFGDSVAALADGKFLVADPFDDVDDFITDSGAAYVFSLGTTPPPVNQAPTANAGADQTVNENAVVTLDATGSTDPENDQLTYAWDLDNDGAYDDATGPSAQITRDLPGSVTVGLRVTDSANNIDTDTVVVTFDDVAPTADAGADQSAVTNQTVTFTGSGASVTDAITALAWDLDNDGAFDDATGASASTTFATTGAKTVRLQVTDDDGQTTIDTLTVNVTATAVVGGTLYVGGTGGSDTVTVKKNETAGSDITVNGVPLNFTGDRVVIYGGIGSDTITVSPAATVAIEAYGGGGNDSIAGGSGNDIIVGGDGNDSLYGGAGLDLIIGGSGGDGVYGEVSDDILIAPATVHDNDSSQLNAIMSIWTNGASFATRVQTLRDGLLTAGEEVKLDVNDGVDILTGKNGDDWFIYNGNEDLITDVKPTELEFVMSE